MATMRVEALPSSGSFGGPYKTGPASSFMRPRSLNLVHEVLEMVAHSPDVGPSFDAGGRCDADDGRLPSFDFSFPSFPSSADTVPSLVVGSFDHPSPSSSNDGFGGSDSSIMPKRPSEEPCPHMVERLKKLKVGHRAIRSVGLLGFRPASASSKRTRSLSADPQRNAWLGSTCSISSRMAPLEAIWTDDVAAPGWAEPTQDTFRRFERMCLNTDGRRRRAVTAPEAGSVAASSYFDASHDPLRLSPEAEVHGEALVVDDTPLRPRARSAPACLDASPAFDATEESETIEDPAVLKAQLLSVLRSRALESGGSASQPGDAALKLRKWVCWNSWTRRRRNLTPPESPRRRRIRVLHPIVETSYFHSETSEEPVSAFDDADSSDDAEGEDDDEVDHDAMNDDSDQGLSLTVDAHGHVAFAIHADEDDDAYDADSMLVTPPSSYRRAVSSSIRDTPPPRHKTVSLPPTPDSSPRTSHVHLPSIVVSRTAEAHPVEAKRRSTGFDWTASPLPTPPATPRSTTDSTSISCEA